MLGVSTGVKLCEVLLYNSGTVDVTLQQLGATQNSMRPCRSETHGILSQLPCGDPTKISCST